MRPCECGHPLALHCGFFDDCLGPKGEQFKMCDCRQFVEAPRFFYLRRLWAWLREVPR